MKVPSSPSSPFLPMSPPLWGGKASAELSAGQVGADSGPGPGGGFPAPGVATFSSASGDLLKPWSPQCFPRICSPEARGCPCGSAARDFHVLCELGEDSQPTFLKSCAWKEPRNDRNDDGCCVLSSEPRALDSHL